MRKLLVVVDYQEDFVDGSLGFEKAETLEQGIYDRVNNYLEQGHKVIFTYDTHFDNYLETREGKNLPIKHCIIGTEGHKLYGRLKEFIGVESTFHHNKEAFSIAPEEMIKIQQEIGDVEQIELVGIVTNMCVISNVVAFQSLYRNADIIVDSSLCASFNSDLHDKALDVIEGLQVKVIGREE